MVDMSQFIAARSDQLNADDLMDSPRTITITKVTASPDSAEQPVSIHYEGGEGRPWKPCKTMRRILVGVWGKDATQYVGRSLTLYRDPKVAFGGLQVGGIRVSHMSHISDEKTVALQVTRGRKAPFTIQPLKAAPQQQQSAQPQGAADQPTKWANGYIAQLAGFTTLAEVQAFASQHAETLEKLQEQRPELHEKVTIALATRSADLAPAPSSFDDDLTGKPADEHPMKADAAALMKSFDEATAKIDVIGLHSQAAADIPFMPKDLIEQVEESYQANLKRLEEAEKAGAE